MWMSRGSYECVQARNGSAGYSASVMSHVDELWHVWMTHGTYG